MCAAQCSDKLPNGQHCPKDKGPYFYADPDHCSRYWQCDNGCASHLLCEKDYLYDDLHKWCNYPKMVDCGKRDCDGRPCKDPEPPFEFTCPEPNGLFPDPKNCMKYYNCYEKVPEHLSCQVKNGQQLLYDPTTTWCDWPDRVNCGARPICDKNDKNCNNQPTQKPVTTKAPNDCDSFGACSKTGELRGQGKCKNCFCECGSGKWLQICCQPHLVFNDHIGQCDWPYNIPECQ